MCASSPPAPEPVDPVPQRNDAEVKERAAGERKRRALATGSKATILTGGLGDASKATTTRGATLIGGTA